MVQDVRRDEIGVILFGRDTDIKEGTRVIRTGSKNLHIRVTAQLKLLPKLGQMLLLLTTDIIWLVFCIIVVNVGTDFIISMSDRPMVSGALMLDMRYVYAAVPIAFTLQAVRLVERWWRIFTKRDPLVVPSEEVF